MTELESGQHVQHAHLEYCQHAHRVDLELLILYRQHQEKHQDHDPRREHALQPALPEHYLEPIIDVPDVPVFASSLLFCFRFPVLFF